MAGPGYTIASVSGSTGAYDLTFDNGETLTGYDETVGNFSTATPTADDICFFGLITSDPRFTVANAEVIPADLAAVLFM
jgi:hypothetical protein